MSMGTTLARVYWLWTDDARPTGSAQAGAVSRPAGVAAEGVERA
jgi:hypothetical protein